MSTEEFTTASPAVQAHYHAVRTDDALRRQDFRAAAKEGRLASEKFLEAAASIDNKRTTKALEVLADNYEYRAAQASQYLPKTSESEAPDQASESVPSSSPNNVPDPTEESNGKLSDEDNEEEVMEETDPEVGAAAESQLNAATAEMEELRRKLGELGLSRQGAGSNASVLMSSRHLSSALGDSFCLLPSKSRAPIGLHATTVDGESTLRAAVASRLRNQRKRLMEQHYGQSPSNKSSPIAKEGALSPDTSRASRSSSNGSNSSHVQSRSDHDKEHMEQHIAHNKQETVRLLNSVKTLSAENSKLLKKLEALSNVQAENQELQDSMEKFKAHYDQKFVMIKRALEEWRRQRDSNRSSSSRSTDPMLEARIKMQEQQIQELQDAAKAKDEQLAKYEKWYKTLRAGAKAKQRIQSHGPTNSFTDSSSLSDSMSGSIRGDSFTAASGLQHLQEDSETSDVPSKPPTHPNRKVL